jgi:RNA polymerase subunit RPABC4/transcription elongation factor Spt4
MASLQPCPACKRPVSSSADLCPYCGHNLFARQVWTVLGGFLAIVGVLYIVGKIFGCN